MYYIEYIKTDNPKIFKERRIDEYIWNIDELQSELDALNSTINNLMEYEIKDEYDDDIKEIIEQKNGEIREQKKMLEVQKSILQEKINKLCDLQ